MATKRPVSKRSVKTVRTTVNPPSGVLPAGQQHELDVISDVKTKAEIDMNKAAHNHLLQSLTRRDTVGYLLISAIVLGCFWIWHDNISVEHNAAASHILTLCVGAILGTIYANAQKD